MERSVKWLTFNLSTFNFKCSTLWYNCKSCTGLEREELSHCSLFLWAESNLTVCVLLLDCQLIYLEHGAERIQGMLWWRQSWTPFHPMKDSLFYYEVWPECEIANICCPLTIALSQGFPLCSYLDGFYLFTFSYLSTWADRMDITVIVITLENNLGCPKTGIIDIISLLIEHQNFMIWEW